MVGEKAFIASQSHLIAVVVVVEHFLVRCCLKRALLKTLVVNRGKKGIGASKVPKFLSASEPQLILHLDILRC